MTSTNITDLRNSLRSVLAVGKSQSEYAIKVRQAAHRAVAHSYPRAVEDAVVAAAATRSSASRSSMFDGPHQVVFGLVLEEFGTYLIDEVLEANPELLAGESAAPGAASSAPEKEVEVLRAQILVMRAALKRMAEGGPEKEPQTEDYDDTESAYNNGEDVNYRPPMRERRS